MFVCVFQVRPSVRGGACAAHSKVTSCRRSPTSCLAGGGVSAVRGRSLSGPAATELSLTTSAQVKMQQPIREQLFVSGGFSLVCSVLVLRRFQTVPRSDLTVSAEDTDVLQTMTSDLSTCVRGKTCSLRAHQQGSLYPTHWTFNETRFKAAYYLL